MGFLPTCPEIAGLLHEWLADKSWHHRQLLFVIL
jgi:hypothetical protein